MRLHTLELRAFGPYATGQRIDFDRLAASGLFLLEGPTGAGKSTILDAITFALYGGLAGEESGEDRLRSHFADPAAEPTVTLEFSLHGTRYRVTRVPEHRRPKKRGEGFTTEASRVHLERQEAGAWRSLTSNKAEAGEVVTEAVGLSREQFTQVMLLPQGEFARFLRARDDDRRDLLTKLFGTQLYDRVTAELDRRRYDAARQREEAAQAVSAAVSAAAEAAGLDAAGRTELLSLPRADSETRLKEESEGLAETMAVTGEGLELAIARVAASRAAAEQAGRQAALMARLTQALADLRGHEGTRAEHDRLAVALDAARRAEPVRPLLTALAEADAAAGRARDELLSLIPGPSGDMLAGHGGAGARERAEAAERAAAGLQHLADVEGGLPTQEAELAAQEEAARKASDRVAALEEARGGLPAGLPSWRGSGTRPPPRPEGWTRPVPAWTRSRCGAMRPARRPSLRRRWRRRIPPCRRPWMPTKRWWTPIRQASMRSWAAWQPSWPPSSPPVNSARSAVRRNTRHRRILGRMRSRPRMWPVLRSSVTRRSVGAHAWKRSGRGSTGNGRT